MDCRLLGIVARSQNIIDPQTRQRDRLKQDLHEELEFWEGRRERLPKGKSKHRRKINATINEINILLNQA